MYKCVLSILILLVVLVPSQVIFAGQESEKPTSVIKPLKIEKSPSIDAVLDEEFWEQAEIIDNFIQKDPNDKEPATEKTEVRICYDSSNLYFGIKVRDSEPERLVQSIYARDGFMPADDSILMAIDSNLDNRTAYVFEMNSLGAKTDIELSEEGSFNIDWDAIWDYAVKVDSEGYTIEAVIPFFILRFNQSENAAMGLLIKRRIRKNNEDVNWPYLSRDHSFNMVSQYGRMEGLSGIERGKKVEIKPYGIGGFSDQVEEEREYELDAGLDVKWGVTSGLTADLTVNPDFAQVESDALRVNLTRFSLFYPEKREFFLERADLFQFGLLRRAEVFFSRRIGIQDGQAIPIIAGGRTYGLIGNTNIGFLTMQTSNTDDFESENFTVGRVKQNIFGRSYVGGILTSRLGDSTNEDVTAGGDFMFLLENNLRFHGQISKSNRPGSSNSEWFGSVGAVQFTDEYNWEVRYDDIGEFFDPGIGFVMRPDQRTWTGYGEWTPRPGWKGIRQLSFGSLFKRTSNHDNILETQRFQFLSGFNFQSDDNIRGMFNHLYDYVPYSYPIAPGVEIPAGEYENNEVTLGVASSPSRQFSGRFDYYTSSFYGGRIHGTVFGLSVRPFSFLHLDFDEDFSDVKVPSGQFNSALSRFFVSYYLSPRLSTRLGVQHSSLYGDFVLNFRVRWIYAPGSEMWIVYNEGRQFDRQEPSFQDRALILKIVHNFNF